jgi:4-aminobutyrate aminotransferase/(S)-3-amino-2-methylpropionate transaminase
MNNAQLNELKKNMLPTARLERDMHTCQAAVPYAGCVQVAEKLSQITPVRGHAKVMLVNSGAEALENAVKIARAATGKNNVICFDGGYHGSHRN